MSKKNIVEWNGHTFRLVLSTKSEIYDAELHGNRMRYKIRVSNEAGVTKIFEFTDSIQNFLDGKRTLDFKERVYALYCFISDAISYDEYKNIDSFAEAFGYNKPSEAIKAFEGCRSAFWRMKDLGLHDNDLYEFNNHLQNTYEF